MKTINLAGRNLAYRDEGSGTTLLLIHAFPLSSAMWNFQIEDFKGDFRVIAPDLAGFGQSEPIGEAASMDQYAADLAQLLTHLGIEKAVLMGLSLGGYVAFAFNRNYPSMVKALILCDTRSEADDAKAREGRYKLIEELKEKGSGAAADLMTPRLYAPQTYKTKPDLVAQVSGLIAQNASVGLIAATQALADRPNSTPDLAHIDVPCLVLVGKDDIITPPDAAREMAKAMPDWQFAVIPQAGHLSNLENPLFFNQVVGTFLKGLKGEGSLSLVQQHCVACDKNSLRVSESEITELMPQILAWQIIMQEGVSKLERTYLFKDFQAALAFTNRVGALAESEGHHPALLTEWGKVSVRWWTHTIRGLHRNDFVMAAKTDNIFEGEND